MDIYFDQKTFDIHLEDSLEGVDLVITKDSTEDLMQRLFFLLKTQKRDIVWNINYGVDYMNNIFGKNKKREVIDEILKNEILKEPMVDKITYFKSEIFNYSYACKFSVKLKEEETTITYYILTNESGVILTDENGDTLTIRI